MSIFNTIKSELGSLMKLFRAMEFLHQKKIPFLPGIIMRYIRVVYSCELPIGLKIGKRVRFEHSGLGVVIHKDAIIGDNTTILQNVTIGGRNSHHAPNIGRNVYIGCGACILGGVKIGDNVMIGANAVVIKDIPDNAVVVGIPGKVIKMIDEKQQ
ncbi:serine acetyltransferase [Capnocytophaga stomatis]|uniref:serine O-acetyltransferase n=1 Tax=Capnocytophaga stomatis TaxID=1848904 RepID=UPI001951AF63|nr:serine O-acetyltransferase [Capnocytophaga stomatis]GIJ97696.1 serine acetyltransferase [Capnocytophaga stomatis]GIM48687.1 serine acetyltransferase [Capnocytophaga stomatis]